MKVWKKVSEDRYELFLKDPSTGCWDVVLYIEKDGTMSYSFGGLRGGYCSHKGVLATDIDGAKREIEKDLLDDAVKTLKMYQETCQRRIDALSE